MIVEDLRTETRFHDRVLLRDHGVVSGLSVQIGRTARRGACSARTLSYLLHPPLLEKSPSTWA